MVVALRFWGSRNNSHLCRTSAQGIFPHSSYRPCLFELRSAMAAELKAEIEARVEERRQLATSELLYLERDTTAVYKLTILNVVYHICFMA